MEKSYIYRLIMFVGFVTIANSQLTSERKPLSQRLRDGAESDWQKHFKHPFLLKLKNKSLEVDKWRFYILQDFLFLQEYVKVHAITVARTKNFEELLQFSNILNRSVNFLKDFPNTHNITDKEIKNTKFAPTNYAYTNHYNYIATTGTLPEIVTCMLPCLWLYDDIEKKMGITFGPYDQKQSTNGQKNQFVSKQTQYFTESMTSLQFYRTFLDGYDKKLTTVEETRLQEIFNIGVKYEYLFWDMSWTKEQPFK